METCCGYGYGLARKSLCPSRFFKGRQQCTGHRIRRGALRVLTPISPAKPIPWDTNPNKEEITLPGTTADFIDKACVTALTPLRRRSPWPGSGILTWFPFDRTRRPLRGTMSSALPQNGIILSLRTDWPMFNCCSHGTLLHTSVFKVPTWILATTTKICTRGDSTRPRGLGFDVHHGALLLATGYFHTPVTVRYRSNARALSIFRAGWFGRWVVTHSLADFDFHDHRPAVFINQHLLWFPMSVMLGTLTGRLVHPTAPVLLTKSGPLGTPRIRGVDSTQASQPSYPFRVWE